MPVNKPLFINTDASLKNIKPEEALFIKDVEISVNKNGNQTTGTANPSGEGQNEFVLTPVKSNKLVPNYLLPTIGFNKNIGSFECKQTNEAYDFTYNSEGQHCIHVINGNDGSVKRILYPYLNFTDDQEGYISDNRCILRVIRNAQNEIIEKILMFTDYRGWQKWVNTLAAIESDSFNDVTYPYWVTKQPHFDRRELVEWPPRPPMFQPILTPIQNTLADKGTPNRILDMAIEVCIQFINTDGRETSVSPYSLPAITKTTDFLSSPDLIPKKYLIKLQAGSPLTEKINIFIRVTTKTADSDLQRTFSSWFLYDTIYKFQQSRNNVVIGTRYWERTGAWSGFNYDSDFNTIEYIFDNTKAGIPVDQKIFRPENDMPQVSCALADAGDAAFLSNNRHQYDNFSTDVTDKFNISVVYNQGDGCMPKLNNLRLYIIAVRDRLNVDTGDTITPAIPNGWLPQVGYYVGDDKQFRFGGWGVENDVLKFDVEESKQFGLDFADRTGFVCYLKGTPYFSTCEWMSADANANFAFTDLPEIDALSEADRDTVATLNTGSRFIVGVFNFTVPAGRYDACIGRHNVPSDQDYQGQSTYVLGIGNSRAGLSIPNGSGGIAKYTLPPAILVTNLKEIEVDCTAGDVDVWGRGVEGDLFYVYCPFQGGASGGGNNYSLVEGYLQEDKLSRIPVEYFSYESEAGGADRFTNGVITDKNGFYFSYKWFTQFSAQRIRFQDKIDCGATSDFTINQPIANHWGQPTAFYFSSYHSGYVGVANRVLIRGTITNTGGIPLSRISVSITGGATDYTDDNGNFQLVVHNGLVTPRVSNIYINAGGNFTINMPGCLPVPVFIYDETSSYYPACVVCNPNTDTCSDRVYGLAIDLAIEAKSGEIQSLKSGAPYIVDVVGHDLAGRQTYCNRIAVPQVPSFPNRPSGGNIYGSSFLMALIGQLRLNLSQSTIDIAYISFYVSKNQKYNKYLQWVGDKIEFLDQNGNVTTNIQTADIVRINIQSLLDTNIQNNFTLLSTYQFVINDRLRIFDNGDGVLFDTATYGDVIDVEIQGTNYNQAAINANLVVPPVNTVLNNASQSVAPDPTTLYVKYDSRFDKLNGKTGFWIELYTPELTHEILNFGEASRTTIPIIQGEMQDYTGGGQSNPQYVPITQMPIQYWDTYFLRRTIIGLGKYISHPFESPNISDVWGVNGISSGRSNYENPEARQQFWVTDVIKSDVFITNGVKNGMATFYGAAPNTGNRKTYKRLWAGGIIAMRNAGNLVFILQEKGWFTAAFNAQLLRVGKEGQLQTVNLSDALSEPNPNFGRYGCDYADVATVFFDGQTAIWYDSAKSALAESNWQQEVDLTDLSEDGRSIGISSYYNAKSQACKAYNIGKANKDKIDVVIGYDSYRKQLYQTWRPRRNNSTNPLAFINNRRDYSVLFQETLVFDMQLRRWLRTTGLCAESYGRLSGNLHSQEMLAFKNGAAYFQNSDDVTTWLNFFGVYVRPCIKFVVNDKSDLVKILKNLKADCNPTKVVADLIYTEAPHSFSYIPLSWTIEKEQMEYMPALRDMASYPKAGNGYSSMLMDGKPVLGSWISIRVLPEAAAEGQYFELNLFKTDLYFSTSNEKAVTPA